MEKETTETIENNVEVQKSEGVGVVTQPEKEEKTFTQEQVNEMIKSRLAKVEKKYDGIDLEGYKSWLESQKTEQEKLAEREKEYQSVLNENKELKVTNALLEKGVDSKFLAFVSYEVSKLDGDITENIDKYLTEHSEYLSKREPVATGQAVQNMESNQNDGILSYLQQMHPELNFKK